MTKEEIFDYVMESPENTNPAILRSMLNELSSGSGGGGLVVKIEADVDSAVLDKTFNEIWEAFSTGKAVVCIDDSIPAEKKAYNILTIEMADLLISLPGNVAFYADSVDSYPHSNNQ